mmetsp:Transcript_118274/g.335444  ORF Transcript_118274/g.335444 Transcript_118274/m.335444 type:complete len:229 (-) Transcript_118274:347-1033(-)
MRALLPRGERRVRGPAGHAPEAVLLVDGPRGPLREAVAHAVRVLLVEARADAQAGVGELQSFPRPVLHRPGHAAVGPQHRPDVHRRRVVAGEHRRRAPLAGSRGRADEAAAVRDQGPRRRLPRVLDPVGVAQADARQGLRPLHDRPLPAACLLGGAELVLAPAAPPRGDRLRRRLGLVAVGRGSGRPLGCHVVAKVGAAPAAVADILDRARLPRRLHHQWPLALGRAR